VEEKVQDALSSGPSAEPEPIVMTLYTEYYELIWQGSRRTNSGAGSCVTTLRGRQAYAASRQVETRQQVNDLPVLRMREDRP
jgi:hypothetical protein